MTFDGKIVTNETMDAMLRGQPKGTLTSYIEQGRFVATEDELITLFSFSMAKLSEDTREPGPYEWTPMRKLTITVLLITLAILLFLLYQVESTPVLPKFQ